MPFALDSDPSSSEMSEAINYLLANFGANLVADPNTGIITGPGGQIIGYLYKYLAVKYADSQDGTLNFSNTQTNRLYYGLRNSDDPVESTNPVDYVWYRVTGGFGTTKNLYYKTTGGRRIQFFVSTTNPGTGWAPVGTGSIDLDVITATTVSSQNFFAYFNPSNLQVPRSGSPLTPNFTGITPTMVAVSGTTPVNFVAAQSDTDVLFVNNSWRIGASSTTGYADIGLNNITIGTPTNVSGKAVWPQPTAMAGSPAYITVPVRYKDATGVVTQAQVSQQQLVFVDQGATGDQYTSVYLYQWNISTSPPGNPSGTSTYTWATGAHTGYTGGNGWSTTVPANPGTPLLALWVAEKQISATAGSATTTVSWSSGFSVYAAGQNGATGTSGFQYARPTVYQWALSTPSISGTSTYTWSSGAFTPVPSGWSTTILTAPSPGFTLWAATVSLTDSATATTSTINWTTASIIASGYSGATGASSRIMYARISGNPTPVSGTVTVSGDNKPSGPQAAAVWGSSFNVTWYDNDPDPTSNYSLYQADGIYNGTNTSWSTPYISSLKVGELSAITTNTGNLTVSNRILAGTAAISGTTMTGAGGILYSTGNFSFGNSTTNMTFNGSTITINGMTNQYFSNFGTSVGPLSVYTLIAALNINQLSPVNYALQGDFNAGVYGYYGAAYMQAQFRVFICNASQTPPTSYFQQNIYVYVGAAAWIAGSGFQGCALPLDITSYFQPDATGTWYMYIWGSIDAFYDSSGNVISSSLPQGGTALYYPRAAMYQAKL